MFVSFDVIGACRLRSNYGCCSRFSECAQNVFVNLDPTSKKIAFGLIVGDIVLSITSFVIGLLGIFSVITMPTAAAYALVGISGIITLSWLVTGSARRAIFYLSVPFANG